MFDIELDEGGPTMRKLKLPYNSDSQFYVLTSLCLPLQWNCVYRSCCTCVSTVFCGAWIND